MLSSSMQWKRKSRFSAKQFLILFLLIAVSTIPILFQTGGVISKKESNRSLTVITSHNETIRSEFERGFSDWWAENNNGEKIYINWITPGGGAEVRKVMDTKIANYRKNKGAAGAENVGLDIFFGGGVYEFQRAKRNGYLTTLSVFDEYNYLFAKSPGELPTIPQSRLGEHYYDKEKEWVGVCLSRFGICFNLDSLERLGIEHPPKTWDDLADPRYYKSIALADPTKSGSVTKAFEMILQQKMQTHILENPTALPGETEAQKIERVLNEGWLEGMMLIQKITANARYFSDNATKIPFDVANGDAAAGMCIDFYGRTYNSKYKKENGESRIKFIIPKGGSSISVDPIGVFKNAPQPDLAQGFVQFCLHPNGQMLWNGRPDPEVNVGPEKTALRRLPIRRDLYEEPYISVFTDPDDMPYDSTNVLHYDPKLTGRLFNAIQAIIRVMSIDAHDELAAAWKAIIDHDLTESSPDNYILEHHFHDLNSISYTKALNDIGPNISKMKKKLTLSSRLQDLEKNNFSNEQMKHHYEKAAPEDYPKLIQELKEQVDSLKSFDMMYLEIRQQELAKRFRVSYGKVLKNISNLD